jgi:uncharacterized membrane protein
MAASFPERVISATRRRGREAAVVILSGVTVALWAARGRWVPGGFPYMLENLVLAWIPWLLGRVAVRTRTRLGLLAALVPWLLFFPNAPYVVTDLLHLRPRPPVPAWFDALLYGFFAVAGCALAWTSLSTVRERLARELGVVWAELVLVGVALLSGFGVYLGRFERWNSWDVVGRPGELLAGLEDALCPKAAAFSLLFGLFVWAGYLLVARADGSAADPG